jgi:two-component system NarL family sensor kinase
MMCAVRAPVRLGTTAAFVLFAVVVAQVVVAAAGALATGMSGAAAVDSFMIPNATIGACCGVCGAVIAAYRPDNRLGWMLLGSGVFQTATATVTPWFVQALQLGAPESQLRLLSTLYDGFWPWSVSLFLPLALLYFPDGQLPARGWRLLPPVVVVNSVLQVLTFSAEPFPLSPVAELAGAPPTPSYLALGGLPPGGAVETASQAVLGMTFLAVFVGQIVRFRRGDEQVRRQLLWLLFATALAVVLVVLSRLPGRIEDRGFPIALLTGIVLVPISMAIAVVRHRLLDIRLLWLRALTYALLTAVVVAGYLALVWVADSVLRSESLLGSSVLATLVVAIAFNPLRVRLQRGVEHLLYGRRSDPVRAATSVTAELAVGAVGPAEVLPALCKALRLPWARLVEGDRVLGEHGARPELVESVTLRHAGEPVGTLEVGVRSGQRGLDAADRAVLDMLAVPIAVAVRASTLSAEVQASRLAIVAGREEERRRLRGDLHDGLGPTLTGIAFQADAVVNLAATDPDEVRRLGIDIRDTVRDAIADVRRLINELRPAALDEVGLVEAVRRHAHRFDRNSAGDPMVVRVVADDALPVLPAAVEVAAYRIVTEALTNTVRHSTASVVEVAIAAAEGTLRLAVRDDGGPGRPWVAGVGLHSLRDRAAELGGRFEAAPTASGGLVTADLPVEVRV